MRVAHACYRVTDIDRSLAFYTAVGFEEVVRLPLLADSGWAIFLALDGDPEPRIELWRQDGSGACAPGEGYGHVGIVVDDLDALLAHLAHHGITPQTPPFRPVPGAPTRLTFIRDPDGYELELLEHYPYSGVAPGG